MKSLYKIITAAALVTFVSFANAQTGEVTDFVAGTAATAASVNANFDALITVIDDLTEDVAALQAEVESLGGSPANVTLADLVGNNYCISFFGNQAQAISGNNFASIESYVGSVKLAITSTSEATMTVVHDENFELGWHVDGGSHELVPSLNSGAVDAPGSVAQATINSLIEGMLTVTIGEDVNTFNLSPDGNMILRTNFDSSAEDAETNLIIGIRCI